MEADGSDNYPPAPPLRRYERCLLCPMCNARTCRLGTSKTESNRQFYACPQKDHKFFVWADELKTHHEFIDVPYCGGCEAGLCRVRKEKYGPNAGRILLMCRVKEGQGSCGYRMWKDELDMKEMDHVVEESTTSFQPTLTDWNDAGPSTLTDFLDPGPANIDPVEENTQTDDGPKNESQIIDKPHHLHRCRANTSKKTKDLKCIEDNCGESERMPLKRSRDGELKGHASLVSADTNKLRLDTNSVFVRQWWMRLAIEQNLGPQLQGWWGRLAFPPLPGLTIPTSQPSTCGIFPPLESITMAQDNENPEISDPNTTLTMNKSEPDPPYNWADEAEPSTLEPLCAGLNSPTKTRFNGCSILTGPVSKAFKLAAEQLQSDLITLLDKTDFTQHEAMTKAAEATYDALDHLFVDYEPFKERTNLFIHWSKSLSDINLRSTHQTHTYQELRNLCCDERMRLDELNLTHDLLDDRIAKKRKHLSILEEEMSYTKDLLFRVEVEFGCGLVELEEMESRKEEVLEEKEVLEVKYVCDRRKLEESRRLEVERESARAGFERARAFLRY